MDVMTTALRPGLGRLPPRIARLPVSKDGWPVPWFVASFDGVPDFRVVDTPKWGIAVKQHLCWVCGDPLGVWLAFLLGPMCTITRTISEPPSHRECAEWSAVHCPFLSNPEMVRRHANLPTSEPLESPGGIGISRNPGVTALWMTRSFEIFRPPKGVGEDKPLVTVGTPHEVVWYAEGRLATRAEVQASIESGLPALLSVAALQGKFAMEALGRQYDTSTVYWPDALPEGSS